MELSRVAASTIVLLYANGCGILGIDEGSDPQVTRTRRQASTRIQRVHHETLIQKDVDTLLRQWIDVQNQGDWTTYLELHTENFTGIDESKETATPFNRDAWVERKAAKLKNSAPASQKFSSKIQKLALASHSAVLRVELTPTESPMTRGATLTHAKELHQLVIVRDGRRLKISRDTIIDPSPSEDFEALPMEPEEFAFVSPYSRGFVLLLGALGENKESPREPRYISDIEAEQDLNEATLEKHHLALRGKTFRLYGEDGLACIGTVDGFLGLARLQPPAQQEELWKGRSLKSFIS
ncbi:MAG: hypothetical protein MK135_08915, partial [Polyangiaceae bacterium]|nr:hypothetical protein [Polyangiaceae bacterium]